MQLGQKPSFLVLSGQAREAPSRISIVKEFASAIRGWDAGRRISPVWGVREFGTSAPTRRDFAGPHVLLFLGPIAPFRLKSEIPAISTDKSLSLWVTLGCLNVVLRMDGSLLGLKTETSIRSWARGHHIPFERWIVQDGLVTDVTFDNAPLFDITVRTRVKTQ